MESQLQRPQHGHHHHEDDPQSTGLHSGHEGEHDQHGEKKSVLKKVKDKAKKIKDTIKKHGHGHGHEEEHEHQGGFGRDVNFQQRYEEDTTEKDPELHGAPMYESSVVRITDLPREKDDHLRKRIDTPEDRQDHNVNQSNVDEQKAKIGPPMGLQEDRNTPENTPAQTPSNYQSKASDPTGHGGKEASVSQFDTLNGHDASNPKPKSEHESSTELNPNTQDPSQNTITGKVSSAASAISDKAVTAKNVVASKMGYGGSYHEESRDSPQKPALETATEYAQKVAEKLTPVYEKVAGAGTAVMSKVQGGGDEGVSMGEYLSEKLKPGEEDKALSEEITDTLLKQKDAMWKTGEAEEEKQKQTPPLGKVTESEEVTARLGPPGETKREGEDAFVSGAESSGEGLADRLTDAFSLWLGKSTGIQTAQESITRSHVSDAGQGEGVAEQKSNQGTN